MSDHAHFYLQVGGWIGNICFVYGAYLLAQKKPRDYAVLNIIGNAAYIAQGFFYENWSLLALSCLLASLSALLLYKWKEV